jgi:hypothetical protein
MGLRKAEEAVTWPQTFQQTSVGSRALDRLVCDQYVSHAAKKHSVPTAIPMAGTRNQ